MKQWRTLSLSVALATSAVVARADIMPSDVEACIGKAVGETCPDGVCTKSKCTRIDYANWDRRKHEQPPVAHYDCVRCLPAASQQAEPAKEPVRPASCNEASSLALWVPIALALSGLLAVPRIGRPRSS